MKMIQKEIKNRIGIVLIAISIVLLLVYGIDAIFDRVGTEFLPFNAQVRGFVLGIPSVVLPLIAFAITWKSPSKFIGILLLVAGIIILIGSTAFIGLQESVETVEEAKVIENLRSFAPVMILGAIIMALGIWKLVKS